MSKDVKARSGNQLPTGEIVVNKQQDLFEIIETDGVFLARLPGAVSDLGVMGYTDRSFLTREEAEEATESARDGVGRAMEFESLRKSFSSFYSINLTVDGRYEVVFPGLHTIDGPKFLVGTSTKVFESWGDAKQFYLEVLNNEGISQDTFFNIEVNGLNYGFHHLQKFGLRPKLSDRPSTMKEETKRVLDFDKRNIPDPESAHTYYKTLEIDNWDSQVFHFLENYLRSDEGREVSGRLGIKDLRLLTPAQAANLSLEVVTRLKKYNASEMGKRMGETESDRKGVLKLLYSGLNNRDQNDFKGNGVCRNFASAVKIIFDSLKTHQTKFNYLNDTYCFFEGGERGDYDPKYETVTKGVVTQVPDKDRTTVKVGHAWNSFVMVGDSSIEQTVVDATWSNIDYDTGQLVNASFTLERMEKDVSRNLTGQEKNININDLVRFYFLLLDSLSKSAGIIMDDEMKAKARVSSFYKETMAEALSKYPGLSHDKYDSYALAVYKKLSDLLQVEGKTQYYLSQLLRGIADRESIVGEELSAEIVKLVCERKTDITYIELRTIFNLNGGTAQEKLMIAKKYVESWEKTNKTAYVPMGDLIFHNPVAQQAILDVCSHLTKQDLLKEIAGRNKKS